MKSNPSCFIVTDDLGYFESALLVSIESPPGTSCYAGSGSVLLSLTCAVPRGNFSGRLTPDQARALARHLVKAAKVATIRGAA